MKNRQLEYFIALIKTQFEGVNFTMSLIFFLFNIPQEGISLHVKAVIP